METTQTILLNKFVNKKSTNENISLNVAISGNKRLLPEDAISDTVNAYDTYINERNESNKYRLIFSIKPYCTNVLFNPFTEIIKNEGSTNVICLNYLPNSTASGLNISDYVIGKKQNINNGWVEFEWTQYDAIRDTQLSNNKCGFDYHCGIDIFNNHILRNKSKKTVNFDIVNSYNEIGILAGVYGDNYKNVYVNYFGTGHVYLLPCDFNTIDDYMRDTNGVIVSSSYNRMFVPGGGQIYYTETANHLYQSYDVLAYKDCIDTKLIDNNGWYGFYNPSNLATKTAKVLNEPQNFMDINKTINNKRYCDFIDMYPGRDLYSFTPKYNENRKRLEKNWNYFITYPSKNVTKNLDKDFPFFRYNENDVSLKAYMIDEGVVDDSGTLLLTVYSICQHGLLVGDTVNIYKGDDLAYDSAEVVNVVDKYIYQVVKDSSNISNQWVELKDRNINGEVPTDELIDGVSTPQSIHNGIFKCGNKLYPICESNRCNIDPDAQDIHFKRVVDGVECKYYVRKFSRLPNFKFKDEEINDYTLYKEGSTLIQRFSKPGYENDLRNDKKPIVFENHISKLGFSDTAYGDDTVEIVFTDDIDTSYLKDNLGRPLSELYLTIVKNNKGYKEWYGINQQISLNANDVEYSHCFGKINSSFVLSDYYRELYATSHSESTLYDVRDLSVRPEESLSHDDYKGLMMRTNDDEIKFDEDYEYYGDICCFSPVECKEESIQKAMCRFNTVQRELSLYNTNISQSTKYFNGGTMYYDEIKDTEDNLGLLTKRDELDPYSDFFNGSEHRVKRSDANPNFLYHTTKEEFKKMLNQKEGYYYQPHYKIQVKLVSKELKTDKPTKFILDSFEIDSKINLTKQLFLIKTTSDNNLDKNDKLILYKFSTNEIFRVIVYDSYSPKTFRCTIYKENGDAVVTMDDFTTLDDYMLLKKPNGVPEYATIIKDGSCRYYWRDIIPNTSENGGADIPFTNGAFYITKNINFYLRRQGKDIYKNTTADGNMPEFDYIPDEESVIDYPNLNVTDDINYEPNQIEEC